MIEDLDVVVLEKDLPEKKLQAGATGTVVFVYEKGQKFEVEFSELENEPFPIVTLRADDIHKASTSEIEKIREVA